MLKIIKVEEIGYLKVYDLSIENKDHSFVLAKSRTIAHNCATALSNVAIEDVMPIKAGRVTHYEAAEVEAAGFIKYDFLTVLSLADIQTCLELINKKNGDNFEIGYFTHKGKKTYIWDLPEERAAYESTWSGETESCFQINSRSMAPFVVSIQPKNIVDLATISAIDRPGPLDFIDESTGRTMADEYVWRSQGRSEPNIKELGELLPETYGVLVYQEQITKIGRILGGFSGADAEKLRENMAKKKKALLLKMKPQFMEGAKTKVSEEIANVIWEQMETFARYGFSIIHAIEYAHITYACMFFKHFYNIEWWAAVLSNATEQEISSKYYPYVRDILMPPDINLSSDVMVVDYRNNTIRAKLSVLKGMGSATMDPIVAGRPYRDIQDFVDKDVAGPSLAHKLIHVGVLDSLFPVGLSLFQKLKLYEDAKEINIFNTKKAKAEESGKKFKLEAPKEGKIPEKYLSINPLQDAVIRKSIFPTLQLDLYSLVKQHSKAKSSLGDSYVLFGNYDTKLLNPKEFQELAELEGSQVEEDRYAAVAAYILKCDEFTYQNGAKRALKLVLDVGGYSTEVVLWPNYSTGQLVYPPELEKGSIATIFLRKKSGRKDMSINGIIVEE